MKKIFTLLSVCSLSITLNAQQIQNGGFENWETVSGGSEPTNWNGFLTADGSLSGFAANQSEESPDVRPGSAGVKSVRIWSRNAGFGIVANGNLTTGRIQMGSTTASSPNNYNRSVVSEADFHQTLTQSPDSIVFWVKFNPASGNSTDLARFRATLHDNHDCRDPYDAGSLPHINASASLDYSNTNGQWVRKSIPFDYSTGTATSHDYILISASTNGIPGGGSIDDEVFIDDIQLIYNPVAVDISEGAVQNPSSCGGSDGSIEVTGNGTGDVSWSGQASGSANGVTLPYTITGLAAGSYTVNFTNGADSDPFTSTLSDPNAPVVTMSLFSTDTICSSAAVVALSATPTGGTFSGDGVSGTDFNPASATINASNTVTYTVDENGCVGTASESVYVKDCEASVSENTLTQFSMVPNPATELVTINFNNNINGTIAIIDLSGKVVFDSVINGLENTISVSHLNKGMYFVQVTDENGNQSGKKLMVK